jgi:hypothetical protein
MAALKYQSFTLTNAHQGKKFPTFTRNAGIYQREPDHAAAHNCGMMTESRFMMVTKPSNN